MDELKLNLKAKIMAWLGAETPVETPVETPEPVDNTSDVKMSQTTLKDGTVVEYNKLEIGGYFLIKNQSDTAVPAPKGEYELMDGTIVKVGEDNLIVEIVPGNMAAEPEGVDPVDPESVEPTEPETDKAMSDLMDRVAVLEELIKKLIESQATINDELTSKNEELKKQVIELSATPMAQPQFLNVSENKEMSIFEKRVEFLNNAKRK